MSYTKTKFYDFYHPTAFVPPDATRLTIELMEVRDYHDELDLEEEIRFVKKLMRNSGLPVSDLSYNSMVISGIISPSDNNIQKIDEMEEKLHERHSDIEIDRGRSTNTNTDIVPGSKGLPFLISIYVNIPQSKR